jgi:hypothetical protein
MTFIPSYRLLPGPPHPRGSLRSGLRMPISTRKADIPSYGILPGGPAPKTPGARFARAVVCPYPLVKLMFLHVAFFLGASPQTPRGSLRSGRRMPIFTRRADIPSYGFLPRGPAPENPPGLASLGPSYAHTQGEADTPYALFPGGNLGRLSLEPSYGHTKA